MVKHSYLCIEENTRLALKPQNSLPTGYRLGSVLIDEKKMNTTMYILLIVASSMIFVRERYNWNVISSSFCRKDTDPKQT